MDENFENVQNAEGTEQTAPECDKKSEDCSEKKCKKGKANLEAEVVKYKEMAEKAEAALKDSEDKYLRILAEYDNFRKRTAKEKEGIYSDAYGDALKEILPIMDTLEMASGFGGDKVVEGVNMTLKQFKESLTKLGIEEIPAEVGGEFDATIHNAVMNANNPDIPSGSIAMVLRKGYKKGDKILRYTMVAVNA